MTDAAPGALESVRAFLNTAARGSELPGKGDPDLLGPLLVDPTAWARQIGPGPVAVPAEDAVLRRLRTDLQEGLGRSEAPDLQAWIEEFAVRPVLSGPGEDEPVRLRPRTATAPAELFCAALAAISEGTWSRLRACPSCGFVFYDSSRNGSRVWCRMVRDDPSGRSCGTLAKVRAKRARDRAAAAGQDPA